MTQSIDRIVIDFIPHDQQRYPTVGDWLYEGSTLLIRVSRTADPRYEQLVAAHELVEVLQCNLDGVSQEVVDHFDTVTGKDLDEPGDSPDAPYHAQHLIASAVERVLASAMHVDWEAYADALEALDAK